MAELQGPTPVVEPTVDLESIEDPDTTQSRVEHEDMVQYSGKTAAADSVPVNHTETNGTEAMQLDDASAALEVVSHLEKKNVGTSKTVAGSKPSMVVKPTAGTKNGPTSPLVKKIINSGTFGAGTVKTTVPKGPAQSLVTSKPTTSAPPLRKSTSAPPPKPDMASSKPPPSSTGASMSVSAVPPTRRASLAPAKPSAPPLSTTVKLTATRPTVVSPTGSAASVKSSSAARPRASVSEGVKRAPPASRHSLSATSKPPTAPAKASAASNRITRGGPSISSITEVKEDGKALDDLQNKLKEAEGLLTSKTEAVTALEEQVNMLKASVVVRTDAEAVIQQLEETRAALEKELKEVKEASDKAQTERQEVDSNLQSVQQTLEATKAHAATQTGLIHDLQAQIQTLEADVLAAKGNVETLMTSNHSEAATAAVEHEALIKAKTDLDAIQVEFQTLQRAHAQALQEAAQKLQDVEGKAARSEKLEVELAELKKEQEDNANKLSELEVEILELKDSQEAAEDEHSKLLSRSKKLEEELSKAAVATQQAIEDAKVKEEEYARKIQDIGKTYEEELKAASEEQMKLTAKLDVLKSELVDAQDAHEQSRVATDATAVEHTHRLDEAEKAYLHMQSELSEQIRRITVELEGQETQYNTKVDAVKAEHEQLLQEAFERAKNEARDVHSQDLQTLQTEFRVATEKLQAAHQTTIESLKAEHAAILESEIKSLEKQINHQSIELKATQDDLSKAKAALDSARGEIETLIAQRDEARALSASSPSTSDRADEVERLKNELARTKDDMAAINDMLALTKASLSDMSQNHQIELEEAAKGRAEEVTALRIAHDKEVTALATHKSELLTRLSDLEGELATVKAPAVEPPVPPKSNGAAHSLAGVTKEELQRLHEAHNSKVHDLQADHDRAIKDLKEELEKTIAQAEALQQDVTRKVMEISYLEVEQEEAQDQITRLKEDLGNLTEQDKAQNNSSAA